MEEVKTYCKCSCGTEIVPQIWHRTTKMGALFKGFAPWHEKRAIAKQWVSDNTNKHICACGCGNFIHVVILHRKRGIPKFVAGHQVEHKSDASNSKVGRKAQNSAKFKFTFWQRVQLLKLADFKCEHCGYDKDMTELQFDHIKPLAIGGDSDIGNGQVLCWDCHVIKTAKETKEIGYNTWRYGEGNKPFISVPMNSTKQEKN